MNKSTVKFYTDTFGIENVIIITDNLKTYKNGEGKIMIIDFEKERVHSISTSNEKYSYKGANLFEFESFEFDQIQFMTLRGDAPELDKFLNALTGEGTITTQRRKEIIQQLKQTFAYAYGYDRKNPLSPEQPKNEKGEYLTPTDADSLSLSARRPLPYNLNKEHIDNQKEKDDKN